MDPDPGAVRWDALVCSAPPRPRPGSEPPARQPRDQHRRPGAPQPREPRGGSARPYCRCGAGAAAEGRESPREPPRCPDVAMPGAAPLPRPLLFPPSPHRGRDKAPPAERPRGAGLCLPGRAAAAPPPVPVAVAVAVPCPVPARAVPAGEARGAARPPRPQHRAARGAARPRRAAERGGGRRDRPAARALKRQRHRTPSAGLRPLPVPAGTGPGSRLQAPPAPAPSPPTVSPHSVPRPTAPTPVPGVPQCPPRCPQSPPNHDSHPQTQHQ